MLHARDLHFAFGSRAVLRGVDLQAEPGQRVAILGPNGSGKSTLLRLLGGHLAPTRGDVALGETRVASIRPAARARAIAYVPQSASLAFPFTTGAFVAFGRHGLGRRGIDEAVDDALRRVDLADRADDPLGELSQGQQQRASIARAICQLGAMPGPARFLLADEPTASLDPVHDLAIRALLADEAARGAGVVASLHDLAAAAESDRVVLLAADGSPVATGPPASVLEPGPLRAAFGAAFRVHRGESGKVLAVSAAAAP